MSPFPLVPRGPLLSEVEQELRPSGNRDRGAIVVEARLCDGEGERAHTVNDPILFSIIFAKCTIFDLIMSTEKLYPFNFDPIPCRPVSI